VQHIPSQDRDRRSDKRLPVHEGAWLKDVATSAASADQSVKASKCMDLAIKVEDKTPIIIMT